MFAKLYGDDDGQVLVLLTTNAEGGPSLEYHYKMMPQGHMCTTAIDFKDSEKGWALAEKTLAAMTEEMARAVVAKVHKEFGGFCGGTDEEGK